MVKKRTIIEAWNDFVVDVDDKEEMWEAVLPVLAAFDGKIIHLEAKDITKRTKALAKSSEFTRQKFHDFLMGANAEEKELLMPEKIRRPRPWPDPPPTKRSQQLIEEENKRFQNDMDEEKETLIPDKIRGSCCLITHGPLP